MNAVAIAQPSSVPEADAPPGWSALHAAVNAWRGRCLHLFARAEAAVSEALIRMAADMGDEVAMPLMVGARLEELDRLLALREDAASKAALIALRSCRPHDRLRIFLCHGVATVLTDQRGDWHVAFELIAFRNGAAVRDELFLTGGKAAARHAALNADVQRLTQRLADLATT